MSAVSPLPADVQGGYAFTEADFDVIARHAYDQFGLHLPPAKRDLVYSRLIKRVRARGLSDFRSYCAVLDSGADDERMHMLSALTTNVTHFFREGHHFKTLRDSVLPPLLESARAGGRVRIWSAGCSAGQEPYSIALTVLDLAPQARGQDVKILATDVDPLIVAKAREGRYPSEELAAIPDHLRAGNTEAAGPGHFALSAPPRGLISFGELNLMGDWPMKGPFDIIFCRNVAIYFDKPTQARLWQRFADLLRPGGHLFIGHSERVNGPAEAALTACGVTTYRKTGDHVAPTSLHKDAR